MHREYKKPLCVLVVVVMGAAVVVCDSGMEVVWWRS